MLIHLSLEASKRVFITRTCALFETLATPHVFFLSSFELFLGVVHVARRVESVLIAPRIPVSRFSLVILLLRLLLVRSAISSLSSLMAVWILAISIMLVPAVLV